MTGVQHLLGAVRVARVRGARDEREQDAGHGDRGVGAGEREHRDARAGQARRARPRAGRGAPLHQPLERARQRGSRAERDDRPHGDAGVGDGGEESELVGGDRERGEDQRAAREAAQPGREQRDQDEQRAADQDARRAHARRRQPRRTERLGGAGCAETERGQQDLEP
jgi:hypothetical protein